MGAGMQGAITKQSHVILTDVEGLKCIEFAILHGIIQNKKKYYDRKSLGQTQVGVLVEVFLCFPAHRVCAGVVEFIMK